jgi:hypothetical protein
MHRVLPGIHTSKAELWHNNRQEVSKFQKNVESRAVACS